MSKPDSKPDSKSDPTETPSAPPRPQSGDSRRGAIAGLIIAAVILGIGLWLARDLTAASKMQDCLMSGRSNCNVIEPAR
ncbi:hypothetical protein SAMN05216330_11161 [Bradyrhizobium sp. Ghvi]|uniref:DUF2273 domain-containing protein n=1 Tax=Bradyrhizobium sp. Ghvi TaxID=1855319 RepID=UPI0008F01C38|nr:hypothetical protein [Bradyrhizobium sp. Ghvi]SFP86275.1 hypothetical protein SAMN05216330_11161 [Bradyrhizobium sp. Ghvi]